MLTAIEATDAAHANRKPTIAAHERQHTGGRKAIPEAFPYKTSRMIWATMSSATASRHFLRSWRCDKKETVSSMAAIKQWVEDLLPSVPPKTA
ncbi:MAG: hypothetical protein ABI330_19975, partial [Caldimonas sp.]